MRSLTNYFRTLAILFNTALLMLTVDFSIIPKANADSLYIGDVSDDKVKRFNPGNGQFQGDFIKSNTNDTSGGLNGGIKGLLGLIFDPSGKLDLVNQNVGLDFSGAVLQFDSKTGAFLKAIIPPTDTSSKNRNPDPNAPFAPRSIVLWDNRVLFVAEFLGLGKTRKGDAPGRVLAFTKSGEFLAQLRPDPLLLPLDKFHPRGMVIGPDGLLYVSNFPDPFNTPLGGHVVRFRPETGAFVDVFINDVGGAGHLNRPEGLVFGPDGRLYITSFRAAPNDIDAIRIYNPSGEFADKIDLYQITNPSTRAFAQAILFGPDGFLFVPISGPIPGTSPDPGADTGAVRRYNVTDKTFVNFVSPPPIGRLGAPWYLTFGNTDPGTLAYKGN